MNYGKALRLIRSSRNISQKDLSEAVSLDPSYISLIEKGKRIPTVETLEKIVKELEVPIHLFFLLASGKDGVKRVSSSKKADVAELLLDILLSSEKSEN
jgi:transcriptional regulator with XRE-family HTH domain